MPGLVGAKLRPAYVLSRTWSNSYVLIPSSTSGVGEPPDTELVPVLRSSNARVTCAQFTYVVPLPPVRIAVPDVPPWTCIAGSPVKPAHEPSNSVSEQYSATRPPPPPGTAFVGEEPPFA